MILFSTLLLVLLLKSESKRPESGCQFPEEWKGIWFQSTVRPYITIDSTSISSKGQCTQSDHHGEKFIIKEHQKCYKCIVIYQKHRNVLQYKETIRCSKRNDLHRVCSEIPGDANLYTLLRVDGHSIECPFGTSHGFRFSYNRGKGDCEWPQSELEPCMDSRRLVLNYQACPNVPGSELMSEQLECQATWKDGSRYYMVGKLNHPHAISDEDKFRCFVYEYQDPLQPSEGIFLAQSGDATCNGLFSPHEGSTTLKLNRGSSKIGCDFPRWMQEQKSWRTVDGNLLWKFDPSGNSTLMTVTTDQDGINVRQESKVWCNKIMDDKMIMYQTKGCTSGFICARIERFNDHIFKIRLGSLTRTFEYACDELQGQKQLEYLLVTKTSMTPVSDSKIPNGLYQLNGDPSRLVVRQNNQVSAAVRGADVAISSGTGQFCQDGITSKVVTLILGCPLKSHSDLQIRSSCQEDVDFPREYENTHVWSHNGTDFRVFKPLGKREESPGICLAFMQRHEEEPRRKQLEKEKRTLIIKKLDDNCQEVLHDKRTSPVPDISLDFQGDCSEVTSKASGLLPFGFQHQQDMVFMSLLNLSLFHFCLLFA